MHQAASQAPVRTAERLFTIDVLRGFALLGILLMNIPTFGLAEAAYENPNVGGGSDPLNVGVLILIHILGEGKMRGIFSLLFGASALLLISRGENKGAGLEIADVYYRRTMWLLLFGMIHGYVIWWGDILFPYALLGLILFPFRKLSPRGLIITASILLGLLTIGFAADSYHSWQTRKDYLALQKQDLETVRLTDEQKSQLEDGIKQDKNWYHFQEDVAEEFKAYRGNLLDNLKARVEKTWEWHQLPIYFPFVWDMLGMMLLGMAFYKMGVLTGEKPWSFYVRMAVWGGAAGLAINSAVMWWNARHGFDPAQVLFMGAFYEPGRVAMSLCYVACLVMIVKAGRIAWLTARLAAVGQMAFSNYISHSLICSVIFYGGYGLGLIGKLERYQLYLIVLAIWTFNLTWSPWWLQRYYFGPLEWCWRSLTYWKKQPMRRAGWHEAAIGPVAPPVPEQIAPHPADIEAMPVSGNGSGSEAATMETSKE